MIIHVVVVIVGVSRANIHFLFQNFDWLILMTEPFSDWLSHLVFTGTDLADLSKNSKTGVKVTLNEKLILGLLNINILL